MPELRFYRVLLWLPLLIPVVMAPFWVPHGLDSAPMLVWLVTAGIGYVGVPYTVLALWTDRWLRTTPSLTTRAIWRRAAIMPVQLILLVVPWEIGRALVGDYALWQGLVSGVAMGLTYVLWIGYAYVALACGLTRLCMWAGCVRAPSHASAT